MDVSLQTGQTKQIADAGGGGESYQPGRAVSNSQIEDRVFDSANRGA